MQISVFASGSTGNCALVRAGGERLLIDAGISLRRISGFLAAEGFFRRRASAHESAPPLSATRIPLSRASAQFFSRIWSIFSSVFITPAFLQRTLLQIKVFLCVKDYKQACLFL